MSLTLSALDALPRAAFIDALAGIFEHSPWVAEAVADGRPFGSVDCLLGAMADAVAGAGEERQLALLRAHPDLAGRLARAGGLTAASGREQAGAGLDRLDEAEFQWFDAQNRAYRTRFGFPFIIAVKGHDKTSIKAALAARLGHDRDQELAAALTEVTAIARFRLAALLPND